MTRPFYEKPEDKENERRVAANLAELWGAFAVKLKPACEVDYAFVVFGDVKAIAEIKCRNYSYDDLKRLGGFMLSCHKMSALRRWHTDFGLPIVLAIKLKDGIYAWIVRQGFAMPVFSKIKMMGRKDRGDSQDIEPCVIIPMENFRKILDAETVPTESA